MRDDRVDFEDSLTKAPLQDLVEWTIGAINDHMFWLDQPQPVDPAWIEKRKNRDEYRAKRAVHLLRALAHSIEEGGS